MTTPASVQGGRALPEVEVGVLGPVEVRGAEGPFSRAASLDLVVFLALHPDGASTDTWATALWPDRLMSPPTLHSTASAARRALGRSRDGGEHLPRGRGRLRLAPTVGTDWRRLQACASSAAPARWREGLALVRGRPFDGLRCPDWTVLEGIAAVIADATVELALRLAAHCLAAGDGVGAGWAARRALLASAFDERLYRVLLRAADAGGNPAGVESVMDELVRLVVGIPSGRRPLASTWRAHPTALAELHPATVALYRSLSRRRAPSGPEDHRECRRLAHRQPA